MGPSFRLITVLLAVALMPFHLAGGKDADHAKSPSPHKGECPQAFAGRCTCGSILFQDRQQYVVNCTDAGFNDTSPLLHLPKATQVLLFTGNTIPELKWNILGGVDDEDDEGGAPFLRVMDLSNNGIRIIPGKAFHRVSKVERLILNHNNIVVSHRKNHPRMFSNFVNLKELHLTNAFADPGEFEDENDDDDDDDDDDDEDDDNEDYIPLRGGPSPSYLVQLEEIFKASKLNRLEKLHLEQNEIESFADIPDLFCSLPSLADLHLGDNKLNGLNGLHLSCLPHLRFLDLEKNNIESLPEDTLSSWDEIAENRFKQVVDAPPSPLFMVDLGQNPLSCDNCQKIMPLKEWMLRTRVTVRNDRYLPCNGFKDINCPEKSHISVSATKTSEEETHGSAVALTIFLCLSIVALAVGALYLNRSWINTKMSPVIQTVTRKVQYTTIGRQEDEVREVNV